VSRVRRRNADDAFLRHHVADTKWPRLRVCPLRTQESQNERGEKQAYEWKVPISTHSIQHSSKMIEAKRRAVLPLSWSRSYAQVQQSVARRDRQRLVRMVIMTVAARLDITR